MLEQGNINGISYVVLNTEGIKDRILFFLPGIGAYKENYIQHAEAFAPYYSKIYIVDLPEQGSTGFWQIGVMVDQLADLIRNVDSPSIGRIDLAGHSAGALAILSFMYNFNSLIEEQLLNSSDLVQDNFQTVPKEVFLSTQGLATWFPELQKIRKLVLYAPPDSFDTVFKRSYIRRLNRKSERFLKNILNICVNKPMLVLSYIGSSPHFRFRIVPTGKPQYFQLNLENHHRFLNYVDKYRTLFELFKLADPALKPSLMKIIDEKEVLIQYGSLDWLTKPYRTKSGLFEDNLKISEKFTIVRHRYLGHMLNKKLHPDINMNLQMITNPDVIFKTLEFIQN